LFIIFSHDKEGLDEHSEGGRIFDNG